MPTNIHTQAVLTPFTGKDVILKTKNKGKENFILHYLAEDFCQILTRGADDCFGMKLEWLIFVVLQ